MRTTSGTLATLCLLGLATAAACTDEETGGLAQADGADGVTLADPDATTPPGDTFATVASDTDPTTAADTATAPEAVIDTAPPDDTAAHDTTPPDDTTAHDTGDTGHGEDTAAHDTGLGEEAIPPDSTPTDTAVADTDTGELACTDSCPELGAGPTPVTVTMKAATAQAPSLSGLPVGVALPSDRFGFTAVDIYQYQTFTGITVDVKNLGNTNGVVALEGDLWAFQLALDISLTANTFIGPLSGEAHNTVVGGGCFEVQGHFLAGDLTQCADGWPDTVAPPDQVEFQYDPGSGKLKIKLVLEKDFVVALLPADYQALAGGFITGPLKLVGTLVPIN
jgi:hypothetical protein